MRNKSILFISGIDFKEKSIQVIRKTPEAYAKAGWDVTYIVARDNGRSGSYFYENEINPENFEVMRIYYPLVKIRNYFNIKLIRTIISKIISYIVIIKLFNRARKLVKNRDFKIVYGYEISGVIAVALLKWTCKLKNKKVITRFQGTWISSYIKSKKYLKILLNLEALIAVFFKSDLLIMTDDGTEGNLLIEKIGFRNINNYKFWPNGTDRFVYSGKDKIKIDKIVKCLNIKEKKIFLSVSRLESWKRVDRSIELINRLVNTYNRNDIYYIIVGEGSEKRKLEKMVETYRLKESVYFTGGVKHNNIKFYYRVADFFLSMYDLSNVGNPLLEAIRSNKIIFTLNTGDTSSWIKHKVNGFIYNVDDDLIDRMADDIIELIKNDKLNNNIIKNIKATNNEKLWTWDERFEAEVNEAEGLLEKEF